jgi:glycogen synthase
VQIQIRPTALPEPVTRLRQVGFAGQPDTMDKKSPKIDIKGAKGLWITSEFYHPTLPNVLKAGGLAQVSSTIPWQMKAQGVDMRPIFPLYHAMLDQGFKKADCPPISLPAVNGDKPEVCELYYKVIDGVTCYAIKSPSFSKFNDLYTAAKYDETPVYQSMDETGADRHLKPKQGSSGTVQHSGAYMPVHASGGTAIHQSGGASKASQAKVINKFMFKFNQAVAAFAPLLNGKSNQQSPGWQFNGDADINFFNDWMAGVILGELEAANKKNHYKDKTQSVFFVHNTYDPEAMTLETAKKLGINIPKEVENEFKYHVEEDDDSIDENPDSLVKKPVVQTDNWFNNWLKGLLGQSANNKDVDPKIAKINKRIVEKLNEKGWGVSPLSWGLRFADMVVINERFKETNLHTQFPNDPQLRQFLGEKDRKGLVFDMHHLVSDLYDPTKAGALKEKGFTQLKADVQPKGSAKLINNVKQLVSPSLTKAPDKANAKANPVKPQDTQALQRQARLDELKRFKQHNKLALQKEFNLKKDPNAVVFSMINRPEFRQKGILRIMHTLDKFLTEHPKSQFVMFGFVPKEPNPIVDSFIQSINQNPDFKGRVVFKGFQPQAEAMRLLAGATYNMVPSTYEPYGLSQLEPMKFGTPPVVSDRDGLFATVYDPHVLPSYNPAPSDRRKTAYGQTGYMMQSPTDNMDYLRQLDEPNWKPTDKAIRQSNEAFYQVMHRAYQDAVKGKNLQVGLQSMDYVNNEHNFESIAKLYVPIVEKALARKQEKAAQLTHASPT